ncbi:cation diffusion facilitator family transporter [Pontibacter sp. SGAir0037]|uniref:cation diffusion facilitator family transporter n=1 Tax=Pontibacter sp. SGAir0037 TaxID=2571030 RepID=UPI0010CD28A2|nr:cation diffusion facilitator family transporter [Pontibacter sp. SGAir0037]QCR23143.1 cation transporter [Pontibacter sp. SGAir0037]
MAHQHHHHHTHHHHQASNNIKVAFFLNLSFAVFEIVGGLWINSMAILSDALHDLGDSLSLGLAWYFERLSKKGRDHSYSYGYKRFSLLGAVINSVILLAGSVLVLLVAIPRLFHPEAVHAPGMILFAVAGILVNGIAALRLNKGTSLNEKVVMLHLLEDIFGWAAVLAGGIIMYFFDLPVIDPLLSLVITCFILYNVVKNLREGLKILLQATPAHIEMPALEQRLEKLPEIRSVHDLHLWTLDGTNHILTMHAVVDPQVSLDQSEEIKQRIRTAMADLEIHHVTIELEAAGQACGQPECGKLQQ